MKVYKSILNNTDNLINKCTELLKDSPRFEGKWIKGESWTTTEDDELQRSDCLELTDTFNGLKIFVYIKITAFKSEQTKLVEYLVTNNDGDELACTTNADVIIDELWYYILHCYTL